MKKVRKNKSILDYIGYDIKNFFNDNYYELRCEETIATVMIVYEKTVRKLEFDIFDKVQFHIFFDKENITSSNPINVKLISSKKLEDEDTIKKIINVVTKIYGIDDEQKGDWNDDDKNKLKDKTFKRIWTIEQGESFVNINNTKEHGLTLNILFVNNIVEFTQHYQPENPKNPKKL